MGPMTFTEGSWAAAAVTDTNKLFALHLPVHRLAQRGVAMRFSDAHGHHGMVDEQQGLPDTVLGMGHAAQGQHYVSATGAWVRATWTAPGSGPGSGPNLAGVKHTELPESSRRTSAVAGSASAPVTTTTTTTATNGTAYCCYAEG